MEKLSILIPSRNEPFLNKTVESLFETAVEEIEIIVMLDAYWPNPPLKPHKNLIIVHMGQVQGMRNNLNSAARISTGKYLMKTDAHCLFAKGFDKVLKADCEPDWLAVPRRYSLDAEDWKKRRKPIDYLYLTYPYGFDKLYGSGFHGKKWHGEYGLTGGYYHMEEKKKDILIDDIIAFQGSCWFMHKDLFFKIECLDSKNYNFHQEAQELCFKVWLSGGRVIRNKKTWYAHLHKGKQYGRGFWLSKKSMVDSEIYSADVWMNNKWSGQTRNVKWLIDKFWPLEGWPEDWDDPKHAKAWTHHALKKEKK
jgi:glycosyltransferase involved in cell wall biosynthesis